MAYLYLGKFGPLEGISGNLAADFAPASDEITLLNTGYVWPLPPALPARPNYRIRVRFFPSSIPLVQHLRAGDFTKLGNALPNFQDGYKAFVRDQKLE
jgi:hypothetical protein